MCGIAGIFNLRGDSLPQFNPEAVLGSITHRGPDDSGFLIDRGLFLGNTRLAIIDPQGGEQPVTDESGRYRLVMNGEIFDYDDLIDELRGRGHQFRSRCDTEVVCHLFEERWTDALDRIDGQFAIAVHDNEQNRLVLARDRMGISPLFYARVGDYLVFASEMKAIFETGLVKPEIDPRALDAVMGFGSVPAPRAVFKGIRALQPGHFLEVVNGEIRDRVYWDIPFADAGDYVQKTPDAWAQELRETLEWACKRRLKSDVPVGLYLSGGIDSATIAAMVRDNEDVTSRVFSIAFPEPGLDERSKSEKIAEYLGLQTKFITYQQSDLAHDLPRLVYHSESPMLTTESVPLMALSGLASEFAKVVLTGEGSDETFGGYVYFRWEAIQARLRRNPFRAAEMTVWKSLFRYGLGKRNPFFPHADDRQWAEQIFGYYPAITGKFLYFRMLREMVYSDDMLARMPASDEDLVDLPMDEMKRWDPFNRTLYLSSRIFMAGHLLGAHGDRALMANSVEGRYPFLDRRVQELMATAPPEIKCGSFAEKKILRRAMVGRLPDDVVKRKKKPFLAPLGTPFVGDDTTDEMRDLLSPERIRQFGFFDADKVTGLVRQMEEIKTSPDFGKHEMMRMNQQGIRTNLIGMALTAVVSTQSLASQVAQGHFGVSTPAKPKSSPIAVS